MSAGSEVRTEVAEIVQRYGLGLGVPVSAVLDHYPPPAPSEQRIRMALEELGHRGLIEWRGDRVCWVAPLTVDRVFGEARHKIERDKALSPQARVSILEELSNALVRQDPPSSGDSGGRRGENQDS